MAKQFEQYPISLTEAYVLWESHIESIKSEAHLAQYPKTLSTLERLEAKAAEHIHAMKILADIIAEKGVAEET